MTKEERFALATDIAKEIVRRVNLDHFDLSTQSLVWRIAAQVTKSALEDTASSEDFSQYLLAEEFSDSKMKQRQDQVRRKAKEQSS